MGVRKIKICYHEYMGEPDYFLGFSLAPGIGPKTFLQLMAHFESAEKAWKATKKDFMLPGIGEKTFEKFDTFRDLFDATSYKEKLKKKNVFFIPQNDERFPKKLLEISDPPIGLFVKGNNLCFNSENLKIGVVGTRKMTGYGRVVTEKLVSELVLNNTFIISGLAMGVDALAHTTTLKNNGVTIAVLGCGVDCCYPKENEQLYKRILDQDGAIISEYPLSMQGNKGTFPARNRIISALSDGILVTEAGEESGSLITAHEAIKQNKKVFAVPGPITSSLSSGTSKLLKEGAVLVQSGDDILHVFQMKSLNNSNRMSIESLNISDEERKVLEILQMENNSIDELAKILQIPVIKLSVLLSRLEMKGIVEDLDNKEWRIKT